MNPILYNLVHFFVTFIFALAFLAVAAMLLVYSERKLQAFMQDRYGPLHYGPQGILQAVIDPLKLFLKEDVKAVATDNIVFRLAPMIFFAPVVAAFVILPFSPYMTAAALGTGIVYYVALSSIDVIGVFMAGWGSNNKYALIGGLRSAAQMISYELPLVLALVGVVMVSSVLSPNCVFPNANLDVCGVGSISLSQIIDSQMRPEAPWFWFVLVQPLGLVVYYICGLAETNRTPFDLPEAESELVAGYLTEYSGLRWAMFFLGEYGNMAVVSAIATALFLGGWSGPGTAVNFWYSTLGVFFGGIVFNVIGCFWFVLKMTLLLLVFQWIRATLPRLRADQLMRFAWLYLIPLTLINILITGVLLLIPVGLQWQIAGTAIANWALLIIVVASFRRLTGSTSKGKVPRWVERANTTTRPPARPSLNAPSRPELAEPTGVRG